MNKLEKIVGIGAAALFFPLALIGVAVAMVPLTVLGAIFLTGLLAEAVASRKLSAASPAAARRQDRAE